MATTTTNLHLTKPDTTDPASPAPFNNNFDIIDAQIASLNAYKSQVDDLAASVVALSNSVTAAGNTASGLSSTVAELSASVTALNTSVGDISSVLDQINGEVI